MADFVQSCVGIDVTLAGSRRGFHGENTVSHSRHSTYKVVMIPVECFGCFSHQHSLPPVSFMSFSKVVRTAFDVKGFQFLAFAIREGNMELVRYVNGFMAEEVRHWNTLARTTIVLYINLEFLRWD